MSGFNFEGVTITSSAALSVPDGMRPDYSSLSLLDYSFSKLLSGWVVEKRGLVA
jgi:hypothetical protein